MEDKNAIKISRSSQSFEIKHFTSYKLYAHIPAAKDSFPRNLTAATKGRGGEPHADAAQARSDPQVSQA